MADLWVGVGNPYASVSAAYAAADAGDTIFVLAGTYTDDCLTITRDVKIVGVGGMAHFKSTTSISNGKGIFVAKADLTLENVEFSGAKVPDGNGAGIRYESGDLVIKNAYFHGNQNGILAASNATGSITVQDSEFARNGAGDGRTHGLYVNSIAKLTILDSYFHDTDTGHHVKSRAAVTEIRNSTFDDGAEASSYSIDLPNGGAATIVGNTLIQGASAANRYMVHYGGEVATPNPGAVLIEGNTFINYHTGVSVGMLNQTSKTIALKENTFIGLDRDGDGGPYARVDNVTGVLGEAGSDVVGTSGLDKIDYRFSPGAVNVDLAAGAASDGYGTIDLLNGVEHAGGSRFADVLAGDGGANWLDGGDGADRLSGGAGDDVLEGGGGDDALQGGDGVDVAAYDGKSSDYLVSVSGDEVVVRALNGRPEGVDRLIGVEKLRFADGVVAAPAAPVNAAPTALDDQAVASTGLAIAIDVLANDQDPDGDPLAVSAVGAAQHGVAAVQNGKIVYTPDAAYAGVDGFTYQISDGRGGVSTASVSIVVERANTAPIATGEAAATTAGQAVAIDVLANDRDPDGDPLVIASVGAPQHGSAVVQNGVLLYTPAAGYVGADEFTYQASDGKGGLAQATVSIAVEPAPSAPTLGTIVGTSAGETLKGTDLDELIQAGGGNDIVYARPGNDRVEGGHGVDWLFGQDGDDTLIGGSGYDLLRGGAGNDRLDGGADNDELRGEYGDDVIVGGSGVDTAAYAGNASDYRVALDGSEILVEALVGAEGVDRLSEVEKLKFADGVTSVADALAASQNRGPTPTNTAPIALDEAAATMAGQAVAIDVLANDQDSDGDALVIASVGAPQHGAAVVQNGMIVYTPAAGYVGADEFTYQASDGNGGFAQATVSIAVEPAPSAPTLATIVGTSAGETLKGTDLDELIQVGDGNDIVYARPGDDTVEGGNGVDWLFGQDGDDTLIGGSGYDRLEGGNGDDVLDGGTGIDTLRGGAGNDILLWGEGNDLYFGDAGVDSLVGGAGDETLLLASFDAGNSIEQIDGGAGRNAIVGNPWSNLLDFRSTAIVNVAEIDAGRGDDRIYASTSDDVIVGGGGEDLFVFERGCGADVVADFLAGGEADRIDLQAFDLGGFAALKALCVETASEVTIDLAGADSVTLSGVRLAELSAGSFLL